MPANIPRYLIENHHDLNIEAIRSAFAEAFAICMREGIDKVHLLVLAKNNFPDKVIEAVLSPAICKTLSAGKPVKVADTLNMTLSSLATFEHFHSYGMVIGIYLTSKGRDILDSASARAIVLLPWTEEEGKNWMATWNPIVLGPDTWHVAQDKLSSEVEKALGQLTAVINLSTGLSHPLDKKHAQAAFARLKATGHAPSSELIRQWALQHNWRPGDAQDLKQLAERYFH
jgi:hypothetical protein